MKTLSVWPFQRRALPLAVLVASLAACGETDQGNATLAAPWPMYGGTLERRFFNPSETQITAATVGQLVPRWRFLADAAVTAAPAVADVALSGAKVTRMVFFPAWDRTFYALRADDGSVVWSYRFKTQPGAAFPQASSATVADIGGRRVVYVGSGETLYCFDAASGALVWQFDAGTGCTDCDRESERNEVESSPAVFENTVYFGMDVNEFASGKGGLFAVRADTGTLVWYFDVDTGATCRPLPTDAVRQFDGFHAATALQLPPNFFATRPGCNFDRTADGCGNIWSSVAIDTGRRQLYVTSANCNPAASGTSAAAPFEEAIMALSLDGTPVWHWKPRPVDPNDLDFGASPNLFQVTIGGALRDVVGAGAKDGTYYLLDRDGLNPLTQLIEPYWRTNVVPGGSQGGIIGAAAVGDGRIWFSTAVGGDNNDASNYQRPTAWGLNAGDGNIVWSSAHATPSFAPTSAIPGVVFMGSLLGGRLYAYDATSGAVLASPLVGASTLAPLAAAAVVVDGQLYVGSGIGSHEGPPEEESYQISLSPSTLTALCLPGTPDCPEAGRCNDANPCTTDGLSPTGNCTNTPVADATACSIGAFSGTCYAGTCTLRNLDCDDHNQCTIDTATATGCAYQSAPDGTPCVVQGHAGVCHRAYCDYGQPIS